MAHQYHYQNYDPHVLLIQAIFQLITSAFLCAASVLIAQKYIKRKKIELFYLCLSIGLIAVGVIVGTIPMIIALIDYTIPILNGIPVGGGKYLWWSNFSYVFIALSPLFLALFTRGIFGGPSRWFIECYGCADAIFIIWNVYHGIFVVVPGIPSLTDIMGLYFILLELSGWILLLVYSYGLYKRIQPSIERIGIFVIILSALSAIISYIIYTIGAIFQFVYIEVYFWLIIIATSFLIYVGGAQPEWFQKSAEKWLSGRRKT